MDATTWKRSDIPRFTRAFLSMIHNIREANAPEDDKREYLLQIERAAHEERMSLPHAAMESMD